jgi:hypothetical protein
VKADDGVTDLYRVMYKHSTSTRTKIPDHRVCLSRAADAKCDQNVYTEDQPRDDGHLGFIMVEISDRGGNPDYVSWLRADYFCKYLLGNLDQSVDVFASARTSPPCLPPAPDGPGRSRSNRRSEAADAGERRTRRAGGEGPA